MFVSLLSRITKKAISRFAYPLMALKLGGFRPSRGAGYDDQNNNAYRNGVGYGGANCPAC